jgi:hypothetical protein
MNNYYKLKSCLEKLGHIPYLLVYYLAKDHQIRSPTIFTSLLVSYTG